MTAVRDEPRVTGHCGLTLDVGLDSVVAPGDWVATDAGARYLVLTSRLVNSRQHAQRRRFAVRCARLERGIDVPKDVMVWWMRWYPRRRRRR
jgi:hypothetical protein